MQLISFFVCFLHIALKLLGCCYAVAEVFCVGCFVFSDYSNYVLGYCWTSNRPAWSKIEGRLQISKCWNLLIRTARWVVSQTRVLQRSNTRAIFHNIFIDMCKLVSFSRWPPEPSNAPPTFFSLCSLWVLGTECSHSVYFFVLACSFFKLTPLWFFSAHKATYTLRHITFHNVSKNTSVTAHSIILPASTVINL